MFGSKHPRQSESRQWQPDRYSWFEVQVSLVISLRGPHSNRYKDCLYVSYCEVDIVINIQFTGHQEKGQF